AGAVRTHEGAHGARDRPPAGHGEKRGPRGGRSRGPHRGSRYPRRADGARGRNLPETGDASGAGSVGLAVARRRRRPSVYSRNLLTMGKRQSRPNARGVILMPMGPCRRLYSFRSTIAMTRLTVAASKPRAAMSWRP